MVSGTLALLNDLANEAFWVSRASVPKGGDDKNVQLFLSSSNFVQGRNDCVHINRKISQITY